MTDLDKKLESLYIDVRGDGLFREDFIKEVKQAFADDGWIHSPLVDYQFKRIESGEIMTQSEWEAKAIKDGWVKIITGECMHPDFVKRNCRLNHECEYCTFCGEERHMSASDQDAHDEARHLMDPLSMNTLLPPNKLMSGQEFYDRFEKELARLARWKELDPDDYPRTINDMHVTVAEAFQAAKKACG
jgi:hypothetical protein